MRNIEFVNLTPHAIVLQAPDGAQISIPASGHVARVSSQPAFPPTAFPGVPVLVQGPPVWGAVEGLPEPARDVVYIVSSLVLEAVRASGMHRPDVMAPATGPQDGAVRDAQGRVVAVTRLVAATAPTAEVAYVEYRTAASNSPNASEYLVRVPEGVSLPARGDWVMGESGSTTVYTFVPNDELPLAFIVNGVVYPADAEQFTIAAEFGGEHTSGGRFTIGWCANGAVARIQTGYKLRRERHVRFVPGNVLDVSAVEAMSSGSGRSMAVSSSLADKLRAMKR